MLKRKYLLERASLLNAQKAPLVFASAELGLPGKDKIVAAYACKACDTTFSSNPETEPFCVNCGSTQVEQEPDAEVPDIPQTDENLVAVFCSTQGCGTYNIAQKQTVSALDGIMHCVTCGTVLAYDNSFNEGGDHPADTRPVEKPGTPADTRPEAKDGAPADTRSEPKEEPIVVQRAEFDENEGGDPASNTDNATEQQDACSDRPWRNQMSDVEDPEAVAPMDDDNVGFDQDDELDPDSIVDQQTDQAPVPVSLAAVVLANNKKATFGLIASADALLATLGGVHVATLRKEEAGEYADVLTSVSLSRAVNETVAREGFQSAMKHFGFKRVVLNFPQSQVNASLISKRVRETAAAYHDKVGEIREDMEQCVSLAATGLTRNFFAKHENVLRKGFVQALTSAGVRGADKIVAGVFQRYADDYHSTLFAIASSLMGKSLEVRNEIAEAIQGVNPASTSVEDQDDEPSDIEGKLQSSAEATEAKRSQMQVASVTSISSVRTAAGGRLFTR